MAKRILLGRGKAERSAVFPGDKCLQLPFFRGATGILAYNDRFCLDCTYEVFAVEVKPRKGKKR